MSSIGAGLLVSMALTMIIPSGAEQYIYNEMVIHQQHMVHMGLGETIQECFHTNAMPMGNAILAGFGSLFLLDVIQQLSQKSGSNDGSGNNVQLQQIQQQNGSVQLSNQVDGFSSGSSGNQSQSQCIHTSNGPQQAITGLVIHSMADGLAMGSSALSGNLFIGLGGEMQYELRPNRPSRLKTWMAQHYVLFATDPLIASKFLDRRADNTNFETTVVVRVGRIPETPLYLKQVSLQVSCRSMVTIVEVSDYEVSCNSLLLFNGVDDSAQTVTLVCKDGQNVLVQRQLLQRFSFKKKKQVNLSGTAQTTFEKYLQHIHEMFQLRSSAIVNRAEIGNKQHDFKRIPIYRSPRTFVVF
eukprot:TRINITY_DN2868_c2_g1_i6.p1 TRINITY_DN2868_c2_g1~~TRINITY_DN2868_c2_g1_i6.p1  ORF type:complete len:354 (-),score=36.90 TRINITY_DN2868_c2_g1_i6:42-1103(-)